MQPMPPQRKTKNKTPTRHTNGCAAFELVKKTVISLREIRKSSIFGGRAMLAPTVPMQKQVLDMLNSGELETLYANQQATFIANGALEAEGKNPFTIDSKEPTASYVDFIKSETRYSRLAQQFPEVAEQDGCNVFHS